MVAMQRQRQVETLRPQWQGRGGDDDGDQIVDRRALLRQLALPLRMAEISLSHLSVAGGDTVKAQ